MARPPKYNTAKEIQVKVDEYFQERVSEGKKPIISGLCYHLGFETRQSFYDLEKLDKFSYTVKRARLRIEMFYEEQLMGNHTAAAIFALKNFGWTDKQEIDIKGDVDINPKEFIGD